MARAIQDLCLRSCITASRSAPLGREEKAVICRQLTTARLARRYFQTAASGGQHLQSQLRTYFADFLAPYNFARRLKTLSGLTPYDYICKIRTSEPDRFILDPMPGLNTFMLGAGCFWAPSSSKALGGLADAELCFAPTPTIASIPRQRVVASKQGQRI